MTPAVRFLRAHKVDFQEHPYRYQDHGGTALSARELGVPEHQIIKTLVFQDEENRLLLVLMHGDRQVSAKELARQIGQRGVQPCAPDKAEKATGYKVGGISPFGQRKAYPVYAEATIQQLPRIYINGGGRGYLVSLTPAELQRVLPLTWVQVAR